jgi:hypothetical protein
MRASGEGETSFPNINHFYKNNVNEEKLFEISLLPTAAFRFLPPLAAKR